MVKKFEFKDSCTFGLLLEQRVNIMEKTIRDIKNCFTVFGEKIDSRITELFNHQSSHIPLETLSEVKTQWKIITILSSLLCTIIGSSIAVFIALKI